MHLNAPVGRFDAGTLFWFMAHNRHLSVNANRIFATHWAIDVFLKCPKTTCIGKFPLPYQW